MELNTLYTVKKIVETGMEVWSIEATKRCVMSNLGIAFLPRFAVEEELARGLMRQLPLDTEEDHMTAICAYRKNQWMSPAMELFLKILDRHFT